MSTKDRFERAGKRIGCFDAHNTAAGRGKPGAVLYARDQTKACNRLPDDGSPPVARQTDNTELSWLSGMAKMWSLNTIHRYPLHRPCLPPHPCFVYSIPRPAAGKHSHSTCVRHSSKPYPLYLHRLSYRLVRPASTLLLQQPKQSPRRLNTVPITLSTYASASGASDIICYSFSSHKIIPRSSTLHLQMTCMYRL